MQWLNEKETLEELINQGLSYDEIGKMYNTSGAAIRKAAPRIGIQLPKRRKINPKETFNKGTAQIATCIYCGKTFIKYPSSKHLYCSTECAGAHRR